VDELRADPGFANVTVWVGGRAYEPTQVRELHQRLSGADGDQPGWVAEATRFWEADRAPGGAMAFWLTTPLLWHEPPASVVQRLLATARREAAEPDRPDRLIVATHAGSLRALVAWVAGADLGEPDNAEEVLLTLDDDRVSVSFREHTWRARFPIGPTSWFPGAEPASH
jgi:broad specificity phosphatase PhoE